MYYRRDHTRFLLNNSVCVITDEGIEKHFLLKDLSIRGVGIIGNFSLKVNERVEAIIDAPLFLKRPISKTAKVAWFEKIGNNFWQGGLDFGVADRIPNL